MYSKHFKYVKETKNNVIVLYFKTILKQVITPCPL